MVDFIQPRMPNGGFYSAEDADSEGEEGKFYIWTKKELQNCLTKDELKIVSKVYNIENSGNYIDQVMRKRTGANILHLKAPNRAIADELNIPIDKLSKSLKTIRKKLFNERKKRVRPHMDDKILTDWNGLMIDSL